MKLILAVCCLIAGLCSGIKFSEKYTEKYKLYKSLNEFNEDFYEEVNFFRKGISSLGKKKYLSDTFSRILNEYFAENKIEKFPKFLTETQKNDIVNYFSAIGKSDAETQGEVYRNYSRKFASELQSAGEEQKKYGSLCKKAGLLIGLAAFVILF